MNTKQALLPLSLFTTITARIRTRTYTTALLTIYTFFMAATSQPGGKANAYDHLIKLLLIGDSGTIDMYFISCNLAQALGKVVCYCASLMTPSLRVSLPP